MNKTTIETRRQIREKQRFLRIAEDAMVKREAETSQQLCDAIIVSKARMQRITNLPEWIVWLKSIGAKAIKK